ncbi:MAG: PEP-CTERM sorting domain-containing protein [Thermoguttaceae bacterium]|jgi:hypothetical protein
MKNNFIEKIPIIILMCTCCVLILALYPQIICAEIVNGSFESSPSFDGWVISSDPGTTATILPGTPENPAPEGLYYANLSAFTNSYGPPVGVGISQYIFASAGESLMFDYKLYSGLPPCTFGDVGAVVTLSDAGGNIDTVYLGNSSSEVWSTSSLPSFLTSEYYTVNLFAFAQMVMGGGGGGGGGGSAYSYLYLDNVRLVPEPSIFILLGIGAISLFAYSWRRRKRTA